MKKQFSEMGLLSLKKWETNKLTPTFSLADCSEDSFQYTEQEGRIQTKIISTD